MIHNPMARRPGEERLEKLKLLRANGPGAYPVAKITKRMVGEDRGGRSGL
jgi:hypothetical protein